MCVVVIIVFDCGGGKMRREVNRELWRRLGRGYIGAETGKACCCVIVHVLSYFHLNGKIGYGVGGKKDGSATYHKLYQFI